MGIIKEVTNFLDTQEPPIIIIRVDLTISLKIGAEMTCGEMGSQPRGVIPLAGKHLLHLALIPEGYQPPKIILSHSHPVKVRSVSHSLSTSGQPVTRQSVRHLSLRTQKKVPCCIREVIEPSLFISIHRHRRAMHPGDQNLLLLDLQDPSCLVVRGRTLGP
jgi:hypothetical protein